VSSSRTRIVAVAAALIVGAESIAVLTGCAEAATFNVTRRDDPANPTCTSADCSLRGAVIASNTLAGADVILLEVGTYVLTLPGSGEDLSAIGDLDVVGALTVEGAGPDLTFIKVDGAQDRVFHAPQPAVLSLRDLAVSDGYAQVTGGSFFTASGGCVYAAMLHLQNVVARRCGAYFDGGAISGGVGVWQKVLVEHSTSAGVGGASIYAGAGAQIHDLTVRNCHSTTTQISTSEFVPPYAAGGLALTVASNAVVAGVTLENNDAHWCGGGLLFFPPGAPALSGFSVTGNRAVRDGGGLCLRNWYDATRIVLQDFHIANNHAGRAAGAIDIDYHVNLGDPAHSYSVRLLDSVIEQNTAGDGPSGGIGGAIRFPVCTKCSGTASQSLGLYDSIVSSNAALNSGNGGAIHSAFRINLLRTQLWNNSAANNGGALYLFNGAGATSSVVDSTLVSNVAGGVGGAIFTDGAGSAPTGDALLLRNSTFYSNQAGNGGGALFTALTPIKVSNSTLKATSPAGATGTVFRSDYQSAITAVDSIIAGNCSGKPLLAASLRNIESPGITCGLNGSNYSGILASTLALGPLNYNGGPTPTLKPAAGSLAIDHGDNSQCQNHDQRGYSRPRSSGNQCDIGAVETNGTAPPAR
jgi:hypothetical protein